MKSGPGGPELYLSTAPRLVFQRGFPSAYDEAILSLHVN